MKKDWMKLKIADRKGNLGRENYTRKEIKRMVLKIHKATHINPSGSFTIKDLAVNGNDVMEYMRIPQGKLIGQTLNTLLDLVVEIPELNTRGTLIEIMKESRKEWVQSLTH